MLQVVGFLQTGGTQEMESPLRGVRSVYMVSNSIWKKVCLHP